MATPVRKVYRVILFIVVFLFSLRFIHPYPVEFTWKQTVWLVTTANNMGFQDPEMFYLLGVMIINSLISIVIYIIIMKLWNKFRARKQATSTRPNT